MAREIDRKAHAGRANSANKGGGSLSVVCALQLQIDPLFPRAALVLEWILDDGGAPIYTGPH
jgi:hypothetical protein